MSASMRRWTAAVSPSGLSAPQAHDLLGVLATPEDLRVHLQPVVELRTGRAWGVEALARFPGHPQPGPAAWFSAALDAGWGPALETVALCGALDVLDRMPAGLTLSVNLSPAALLRPDVTELLLDAAPGRLLVEITEHEAVADYDALVRALEALRSAGIRVGIDDFGAGHSSVRHVLELSPDVVKLDISLTSGVDTDPAKAALVEGMVVFCARVGALVIAEGIEQPAELARLVELGVGYGQGWLLARPASPEIVLPGLCAPPAARLADAPTG